MSIVSVSSGKKNFTLDYVMETNFLSLFPAVCGGRVKGSWNASRKDNRKLLTSKIHITFIFYDNFK